MEIKDGKIIKATRDELHRIWLDKLDMIMSFTEYLRNMQKLGVEVTNNDDD